MEDGDKQGQKEPLQQEEYQEGHYQSNKSASNILDRCNKYHIGCIQDMTFAMRFI